MALINRKPVVERETASYKLERSTLELLKGYSEYIDSPQDYIVNQALRYLFRKDRDFNAWLKANARADLAALATSRAKGKCGEADGSGVA